MRSSLRRRRALLRPGVCALLLSLVAAVNVVAANITAPGWAAPTTAVAFSRPSAATASPQEALTDIPPPPAMGDACTSGTVASCNQEALSAIDAARAAEEGLGPLVLPAGFASLSVVTQIVVVTNAERISRHLPALLGPNGSYDALAGQGAQRKEDPSGPSGATWASNLASGYRTPLQADYEWMYDDGPGGTNVDCKSAGQPGCWGHRDNILSSWPGLIGAAAQPAGAGQEKVFAELLVKKG